MARYLSDVETPEFCFNSDGRRWSLYSRDTTMEMIDTFERQGVVINFETVGDVILKGERIVWKFKNKDFIGSHRYLEYEDTRAIILDFETEHDAKTIHDISQRIKLVADKLEPTLGQYVVAPYDINVSRSKLNK